MAFYAKMCEITKKKVGKTEEGKLIVPNGKDFH